MASQTGFYRLNDPSQGLRRELAPGLSARVFPGEHVMLSIVTVEPYAEGRMHSHPEEQWGVLLEGDGVRIQGGSEFPVEAGDFWRTPGGVEHTFRGGSSGASLLDIFGPPRAEYRQEGVGFAE